MPNSLDTRNQVKRWNQVIKLDKRKIEISSGEVIQLQPMEYSLYRLFLAHPEGIRANKMILHRDELILIYSNESRYDDRVRQQDVVDTICDVTTRAFYVYVYRIRKKIESAMGFHKARKYTIQRSNTGVYRIPLIDVK